MTNHVSQVKDVKFTPGVKLNVIWKTSHNAPINWLYMYKSTHAFYAKQLFSLRSTIFIHDNYPFMRLIIVMFSSPIWKNTVKRTTMATFHGCFPCYSYLSILTQQWFMKPLQQILQQLHSPSFSLDFRLVDERDRRMSKLIWKEKMKYRSQKVESACVLRHKRLQVSWSHVNENDDASHISDYANKTSNWTVSSDPEPHICSHTILVCNSASWAMLLVADQQFFAQKFLSWIV